MKATPDTICVSGVGAVSPYGPGTSFLLDGVSSGKTCFKYEKQFTSRSGQQTAVGLVNSIYKPSTFPKRFDRLPRSTQMALSAAHQALTHGKLDCERYAKQVGVFYCSDLGTKNHTSRYFDDLFHKSPRLVSPLLFQNTTFAAAAGEISIQFGLTGFTHTLANGFHSFIAALEIATMKLSQNEIRFALIVASDEVTPLYCRVLDGFRLLGDGAVSQSEFEAAWVPSEGAAALLLERRGSAYDRGAVGFATVAGVGISRERSSRGCFNAPQEGLQRAMRRAMRHSAPGNYNRPVTLYASANGQIPPDHPEYEFGRVLSLNCSAETNSVIPKLLLGEAQAASPALHCILALDRLTGSEFRSSVESVSADIFFTDLGNSTDYVGFARIDDHSMYIPSVYSMPDERISAAMVNACSPGGGCGSVVLSNDNSVQ